MAYLQVENLEGAFGSAIPPLSPKARPMGNALIEKPASFLKLQISFSTEAPNLAHKVSGCDAAMRIATNPPRSSVILSLTSLDKGFADVLGRFGVCKTHVSADCAIGVAITGLRVLITAVNNAVVDEAADNIWREFSAQYGHEWRFPRLKTASKESKTLLSLEDPLHVEGKDPAKKLIFEKSASVMNHPAATEVLASAAADFNRTEAIVQLWIGL